jgi:hypothetical protein
LGLFSVIRELRNQVLIVLNQGIKLFDVKPVRP